MYKIKQKSSDFIVAELMDIELVENGIYAVFILDKTGYNTLDVIKRIAHYLGIKERFIGFAGNKDKNAITSQFITVPRKYRDKLMRFSTPSEKIKITFYGYSNKALFLGDSKGNHFGICIHNLTKKEINEFKKKYKDVSKIKIINYFGSQRFSKNNADVGKAIVKNDFKKAVELISETNDKLNIRFTEYLGERKNDYVGALKLVSEKLLKLFVHAYQSKMWNEAVTKYIGKKSIKNMKNMKNIKVPILGFGTSVENNKLGSIIDKIMKQQDLVFRDFIIRSLPFLSQEGAERDLFVNAYDFEISHVTEYGDNKKKYILKILFKLPKGSYATEVVRQIFE